MKNLMKHYKFYVLLGVLCTLSSFFYAQAGYTCTNYPLEAVIPTSTLMLGLCFSDLLNVPLLPIISSGAAGCLLVATRMWCKNDQNIIIGTKIAQTMIPLGYTVYFIKKKRDLKWCALCATWMELGIQVCF